MAERFKATVWTYSRTMSTRNVTKSKGDQGVGFVIASLMANGMFVALPISEHLPFDLIAISQDGKGLRRVSVKYCTASNGAVGIRLRSVWSNRKGVHTNYTARGDVDAHAIYCPNTEQCYFVRDDEVTTRNEFKLRVTPPKIRDPRARLASNYSDPSRIFD